MTAGLLAKAALALSLLLASINFLTTARWANEPGALHGWRRPWYALALLVVIALAVTGRRQIGTPVRIGRGPATVLALTGLGVLVYSLFSRLPLSTWDEIPFKDDWTPLYQQAVNGIALLKRGVVVGWNWWLLGGYPTSTDIAQNFGIVGFIPMTILGSQVGYHVLHVVLFVAVPAFVWWDLQSEDRDVRLVATGLAGFFSAGYFGAIGGSGDTNSLVGVFCAVPRHDGRPRRAPRPALGRAAHAARADARALHPHRFLRLCRDLPDDRGGLLPRPAGVLPCGHCRRAGAGGGAPDALGIAALPSVCQLQQHRLRSRRAAELVAVRAEGLLQHRDPVPAAPVVQRLPQRRQHLARLADRRRLPVGPGFTSALTRPVFYAGAAVVTQLLLRFNTPEAGAGFDRIQHMFPLLLAPALAGFVLRFAGTRRLAIAMLALLALFVQNPTEPIRHVPNLRAFDPPLIDRIAASDGMVLVEISPHRDMDSHPTIRSQTTPFDVHFEGLLPTLAGQRFYSQSIDGWVWSVWRGQVVGAATFRGRPIAETSPDAFVAEMEKWGVRNLFVWTDETRGYLAQDSRFIERWRGGLWSHFERHGGETRSVVTPSGDARLRNLDALGGEVELSGVAAGDTVVVRTNYYPAWRASAKGQSIELFSSDGQLAFRAPESGSYVVRFEYPRYRAISLVAILTFVIGVLLLTGRRRG